MARIKDLHGKTFGNLTVVGYAGLNKSFKAMWLCKCLCGTQKPYLSASLTYGSSASCGCVRNEHSKTLAKKHLEVHGKTSGGNSKIYRIWANMITRCSNPKASNYKYYGGRGICVSEQWKKFENFFADMGECPDGLTLDRIDVNGNYEKQNCRWADWATQCANKRKKVKIEERREEA
jgi:hypothetical protein